MLMKSHIHGKEDCDYLKKIQYDFIASGMCKL